MAQPRASALSTTTALPSIEDESTSEARRGQGVTASNSLVIRSRSQAARRGLEAAGSLDHTRSVAAGVARQHIPAGSVSRTTSQIGFSGIALPSAPGLAEGAVSLSLGKVLDGG